MGMMNGLKGMKAVGGVIGVGAMKGMGGLKGAGVMVMGGMKGQVVADAKGVTHAIGTRFKLIV